MYFVTLPPPPLQGTTTLYILVHVTTRVSATEPEQDVTGLSSTFIILLSLSFQGCRRLSILPRMMSSLFLKVQQQEIFYHSILSSSQLSSLPSSFSPCPSQCGVASLSSRDSSKKFFTILSCQVLNFHHPSPNWPSRDGVASLS
jgi:hypothetical protein